MSDRCESCDEPLMHGFRCAACGTFQAPDPGRDHFASFGLERGFGVDEAALERRHLELSRELHPDLAGPDTTARTRAVLHSAQLNEAYSVLRDPFRRADYLLGLLGGAKAAEDRGVPDGFLEQMMELRGELDDVQHDPDRIVGFRAMLDGRLRDQLEEVGRLLGTLELGPARRALNVASYYRGMLRDLREAVAGR